MVADTDFRVVCNGEADRARDVGGAVGASKQSLGIYCLHPLSRVRASNNVHNLRTAADKRMAFCIRVPSERVTEMWHANVHFFERAAR